MGEVYAGYDETLQRKVALKGIRPEYHLDEEAKGRFLREARVLSRLGHPNICQIYDYLEGDDIGLHRPGARRGKSLTRAMKKGLDGRIKMRIAEQLAGVLVAAHEKGVIHRDLKPDNVMLTEGNQVKVLDFGISRQLAKRSPGGFARRNFVGTRGDGRCRAGGRCHAPLAKGSGPSRRNPFHRRA